MSHTKRRLSSTMGLTLRSSEGTPAAPTLSFTSFTFCFHCFVLGSRFYTMSQEHS